MSLSHDTFSFFGHPHSPLDQDGSPEVPSAVGRFFGVKGESHLYGEPYGIEYTCSLLMTGYATKDLLEDDLRTLASKIGKLTGTLTEDVNGTPKTYTKMTFADFSTQSEPRLDGSGVNGWFQSVRLVWRRRTA